VEITGGGNHTILPIPLDLIRTLGSVGQVAVGPVKEAHAEEARAH